MSQQDLSADDLTLPIKRTEGKTLQERLTGNAYHNILPARYLRKDANGDLIEDQEELFERVAKNIALAEAVFEAEKQDYEITVTPDQLKPDHPRRDELAEEVFGKGVTVDSDAETTLTEYNVNKFSFESLVPDLPEPVRETVESVAEEFQELMEQLSFMPNCVPPDSMVAAGGGLKQLTDIDPGERVYDDEGGDARVESKFENGSKQVREIETDSGYTVRATPEHYFRVIADDGEYQWRQVKDLRPDDVLALQKNFLDDEGSPTELRANGVADGGSTTTMRDGVGRPRTAIESPDAMTPALAEWLGLYLGDGTARESGVRVAFDEQDDDLVDYWRGLTDELFGIEPTIRERTDAKCVIGQAFCRSLYEFLDRNDLLKDTSKTATVPEAVLESGRTCVSRFLRGLFEADGTVGERSIELYTHSEPLADQVQQLLLGLGIRSKVTSTQDGYRVTVRKNVCGKQFVEEVGFRSHRKQSAAEPFLSVAENASSIKIPNQTERLNEWYQESDLGHEAYRALSQFLIDPDSEYHQEISVSIFKHYAETYPELWESPVAEFVERDQFYERVSEIRDIGRMAVEDMQVPRRNTYVVEGFVSHNSPTLMNAGDELQQLSACIAGHVPVYTRDGMKRMDTVEEGDEVLTHKGRFKEVTAHWSNGEKETIEMLRGTARSSQYDMQLTDDHEVLTEDSEWVEAGEVENPVAPSLPDSVEAPEKIELRQFSSKLSDTKSDKPIVNDGGTLTVKNSDDSCTPEFDQQLNQPYAHVENDEDFAWVLGLYLAAGDVDGTELRFTLGSDEEELLRELERRVSSVFDLPVNVSESNAGRWITATVSSPWVADLFQTMFGAGRQKKTLPEWVGDTSESYRENLLEALLAGDGCELEHGHKITLANPTLVYETTLLARSVGKEASFQLNAERSLSSNPTSRCYISKDETDSRLDLVSKQDAETVEVFDMEVKDDHSFVAGDFVVHNCFVMSPDDDLSDIHETAADAAEVFQSGGGCGYAFWQLRPYGDAVGSTGGIASGPITFMRTYDQLCETIAQGGARRGAQMGVMRISHPDVIQFIHAKNKDVSLAHSLRLNDPDDFTHTSFADALEEARELIDEDGKVPKHLRNAVEGHLSNFNISVGITDQFMEALENGEEYTFTNPRTGEPHVATEETKELYDMFDLGEYVEVGETLSVPADELWEHIIEGAHENGEPGVIYLERVNKEHSFDIDEHPDHRILATNPSLAAGTKVLTDRGIVPIEELEDSRVEVPTVSGEWADAICHRSGDDEPLYEIELSNGKTYLATEEHKWPVLQADGSYERTKTTDIESGVRLPFHHRDSLRYGSTGDYSDGFLVGWLYGDGSITQRSDGETQYEFTFSQDDADNGVMDQVLDTLEDITGVAYTPTERQHDGEQWYEVDVSHAALRNRMDEYGVAEKSDGLPEIVWSDASESFRKGLVDGLFSADGYIDTEQNQLSFVSSKETLVTDVSDLLGFYGLETCVDTSETEKWNDTYEHWDLTLSHVATHRFRETFDLSHEARAATLAGLETPDCEQTLADHTTVDEVRKAGESGPVWDLRVGEETHTFALSHAFTGNCGEQPLEEYEACNLGHINLSTLADVEAPDWRVWYDEHGEEYDTLEAAVDAFLDEAIDFEEFDYRIEMGTRFLENVVTMSDFPVAEIEQTVREMRKIGLGIMGLAQLYIQLGMKYGSDASNEVARQLMRHINHQSKWASHELATDRDAFEEWDKSKYATPTEYREWFEKQTGLDADEWEDGFPIRNHNTTTIAPTGCVDEDSLVSTDEGLQPIQNLDDTGAEFEQWAEIEAGVTTDGGTKTATAVYDNGFADVRRIETEGGFSVTSTPNHRFRTIDEDGGYVWKEADSFEPGDNIVLQRNTFDGTSRADLDTSERENYHHNTDGDLELPDEMSPELAEFLGYFMGDGYLHEDVGVKLVVESEADELDDHLRNLSKSLFGVTPTVEHRDTRHILCFGGRHLPRYFVDNGWEKADGNEGEGAASAFIPEEILGGDEATAKAFLRGLFEADGTASRKVKLSTVSSTLAEQVQTLLLSLGCVFVRDTLETADRDDHYGDRTRHTVRGANKREDKRFLDEIGFITKSTTVDLTAQSFKNDTYPPAVVDALREVDGYDSVSKSVKNRVNQSPTNGAVSRKLVTDVERETNDEVRIDGRRLTDFYVATVTDVTESTAYTKDISVPSNNTYVADGFVTHNTTSMVGNTTGGCEPIYNVAYYKNVSDDVQGDEMLVEFDDYFLRVLEDNDLDVEAVKTEAQEQMAENEFDGIEGLDTVPDAIGELFVTTGDLSAKEHAGVQVSCQEGVDSAISKTVNAPNDSTVEDAKEVFEYIYEHGGKGVTYYRDGTRSKQVLTTRAQNTEFSEMDENEAATVLSEQIEDIFGSVEAFLEHETVADSIESDLTELFDVDADAAVDADTDTDRYADKRSRPDALRGVSQRVDTGYGKIYVTINEDPETGEPFELFANIGHSGGFTNSFTEALAKVISTALRSGVDPIEIVDELQGTRSPKVAWDKGEQIQSIPDAIGTAMRRYLEDEVDKPYPKQQTLQETVDETPSEDAETASDPNADADAATDTGSGTPEPDGGPKSLENTQSTPRAADGKEDATQDLIASGESPECPECGSMTLYYAEGCKTCESCGWSEC